MFQIHVFNRYNRRHVRKYMKIQRIISNIQFSPCITRGIVQSENNWLKKRCVM